MSPAPPARVLLLHSIDYAGLFPPASLDLAETVRQYAVHRRGPRAWLLGSLVVPAARLAELGDVAARESDPPREGAPWPLSVLIGEDADTDLRLARETAQPERGFGIATLEARAEDPDAFAVLAPRLRDAAAASNAVACLEIPLAGDLEPYLEAARREGVRLKARTGGVVADAIPPAERLAAFLEACVRAGVAFKVTAGLHNAIRGKHPLTYEHGAASAVMHGFLNVFVATALLVAGVPARKAESVLEEDDATAFHFEAQALGWRDLRADAAAVERARERLASFGSCSFEEPVAALELLGLA
jgi:hypothetical protein